MYFEDFGGFTVVYVTSDIHGELSAFEDLLKITKFSSADKMYIIGDIIDRGPHPIELVELLLNMDNIEVIKGNHEDLAYKSLTNKFNDFSSDWEFNGGRVTYEALRDRGADFRNEFLQWIKDMPYYKILEQYKVVLMHGGTYARRKYNSLEDLLDSARFREELLWARPDGFNYNKNLMGYTAICGHTPTVSSGMPFYNGVGEIFKLNVENNITYLIDCGCTFKKYGGRLGCLCLDTMEEFYTNAIKI